MTIKVDIDKLKVLYCTRNDDEYNWDGDFTEDKCSEPDCEVCSARPTKLEDKYGNNCIRKKECTSFQARKLKQETS